MLPNRSLCILTRQLSAGPLLLALAWLVGCASVDEQKSVHTLATYAAHQSVRLAYRCESDRLNLGANEKAPGEPSFTSHRPSLPGVTTSELYITHPHPDGLPGFALATVVFRPLDDQEHAGGVWAKLTGANTRAASTQPDAAGAEETWRLDLPEAQLDGILATLRKQNFFQRSKTISPEVFLDVEVDGAGFGKKFSAVPALDALIVRVHQQGQAADRSGTELQIRRLPRIL